MKYPARHANAALAVFSMLLVVGSVSASDHDSRNGLPNVDPDFVVVDAILLLGPGENAQYVFVADCKVPQPETDNSPSVSIDVRKSQIKFTAQDPRGLVADFEKTITLADGDVEFVALESAVRGSLTRVRATVVGGLGLCSLRTAGTRTDGAGRTVNDLPTACDQIALIQRGSCAFHIKAAAGE